VRCGNCCRSIGHILPDFDTGNGTCKHLQNNLCAVYDTRPGICNLETVAELVCDSRFVEHTLRACLALCRRFGDEEGVKKLEKTLKKAQIF
jgi:Fe-S-cluster containining protein